MFVIMSTDIFFFKDLKKLDLEGQSVARLMFIFFSSFILNIFSLNCRRKKLPFSMSLFLVLSSVT